MKLFIFGAGASLAAQHGLTYTEGHPERSPLVDQLFDDKYKIYMLNGAEFDLPKCREEVAIAGSLEKYLTNRWQNIPSKKSTSVQRAERTFFGRITFYIWNLLNTISKTYPMAQGYSELLQKLYDSDVEFGLVSFNYDTLLDQSYQDVFLNPLASLDDYLASNFVKLHGSVNWFLQGRKEDPQQAWGDHHNDTSVRLRQITERMFNGSPIDFDRLQILDPKHTSLTGLSQVMGHFQNGCLYPLLFIPLTGKLYEIVSGFADKITAKAEELFRTADEIYLIGYRANDDLIDKLLNQVKSETVLHIIGNGDSANEISKRLLSAHPNLKKGTVDTSGFRSFIAGYKP